ncbi:ATP-dependent RNA helicase HrpA [Luteolibacter flavescens]|uniref:ATP-dependent RNA helicase HrpA n=1 Tax=Luteolibacter flavescens TaxID=1859460 RepID=A0ABT3FVN1_9BACT|nr:ATP-dependent RNA helicase HrpA [Luteolibacter flavescens]MCW1887637.1 ATP-dependent RNA helicase HrpA [Luteolibacter flavescens]
MTDALPPLNYPESLPVVGMRREIVDAIRENPVVVVVSETGSGKTTQLPKMVAEALAGTRGKIGCTQPRRIAAASVAKRVAEELKGQLGGFIGYQVRFEDKTSKETRIKFMTDGILLAETQGDPNLKQYDALILDEAHERSLNIDFLLGYLKRLLERRKDLKIIISSATLDAGSFAAFFDGAPVLQAEGRTFGVEEFFLPPDEDEELTRHVPRAVDWLTEVDPMGDVLVFLPGEREIRDCADALDGRRYRNTEVLPLFARLGLGDQQRIFSPGSKRRIILATNVAETSLTIPRIVSVVDSGVARVSRWSPARGVQRLQIEEVSQASARQRKGRCGRVREGVCVRLYSEENLAERAEFTDPEIRRSSLAGVILRMKSLGLPDIEDFPFLDPPAPKAISEGYRTLREVGALDKDKNLTESGRTMARMPVDPRLSRMLLEARHEHCLSEILPVVALLESSDPKERPAEKIKQADAAHARWKDADSDFRSILRLWLDLQRFREGRGWKRNQLRKFCGDAFLSYRRVTEWANVHDELKDLVHRELKWQLKPAPESVEKGASYEAFHRSLLAGAPRQFGLWDREERAYRSASGGHFAVFPGSGLFGGKRWDWVMAMELVETTRLWARRIARIDPAWVEQVAPHLCTKRYGDGHWDEQHGAVYAKETVLCGGLPIVAGRRVHFGRIDPEGARKIFVREGLMQGGVKGKSRAAERLAELKEEIEGIEHKLRRPGGLWSEEAVLEFFESRLPQGMCTAKAFHDWRGKHEDQILATRQDVVLEDLEGLDLEGYPDWLEHAGQEYALYYRAAPGERDDGVTMGVHIDQLPTLPDWLPSWGVPGAMAWRAEWMIRSLPKDLRRECQPVAEAANGFADEWRYREKDGPLEVRLAQYLTKFSGYTVEPRNFDLERLPEELVTKIWVCDDEENEIAFGKDVKALRAKLGKVVKERFEAAANLEWERTGMKAWTEGEVPEHIETSAGPAFPALVDEGSSVGVRAFSRSAEAAESHRAGQVRLLMLAQPDQVAYLKKKYPLGLMAKVELPRMGITLEELMAVAAEGAAGGKRIATPAEFAARTKDAKGRWYEAATAIGKSLDATFEAIGPVRQWIHANAKDRNLSAVASDLEEQVAWLLRPRFVWRTGFARLRGHDRYLRGIRSRIGRLTSLPLVKDLEKMERVRKFWQPWFIAWTARPDDPALWKYGWLLEEYRLSLFAPDIGTEMKVSEKRLAEGF